ncbi:tetratricopeptide repeat protein [Lewinella sp. LCG006]|uniref:tetratricopeptide repeat protein n=1 Tax=Lewinella sp. LCG006 TaxID=3231911 RepID=UPI003460D747
MDTFTLISIIASLASIIGLILAFRNKTSNKNTETKIINTGEGNVAVGKHINQGVINKITNLLNLPKSIVIPIVLLLSALLAYGGNILWSQHLIKMEDKHLNFCDTEDTVYTIVIYPFLSYAESVAGSYDFQSAIMDELNEIKHKYNLPLEVAMFKTNKYFSRGAIQDNIKEISKRCVNFAVWGYYSDAPQGSNQPPANMHLAIVDPSIFMGMAAQHQEIDLKAINPIEFRQEKGIRQIKDLVLLIGAIAAYDQGNFKTADELFDQIEVKQMGNDCEAVANYLYWSRLLWYIGQCKRSDFFASRARTISDSLYCSNFTRAQALEQLGNIQAAYHGNAPKAIELIEQAIMEVNKAPGTSADTILPFYYNSLATAHFSNRDMHKARNAQEESLHLLEAKGQLSRVDSMLKATGLVNLSSMDMEVRNMDKAKARLDEALCIEERVYPQIHPSIAQTLNLFSKYYLLIGDFPQALEYQIRILEIRKALLPPGHFQLGHAYHNIAFILKSSPSKLEEALRYGKKTVQNFAAQEPIDTLALATAHSTLHSIYMQLGEHDQAYEHLNESRRLKLILLNNDPLHWEFLKSHFDQTEYYYATKDYKRATKSVDSALIIAHKLYERGAAATEDLIVLTDSKIKMLAKSGECEAAEKLMPTLQQYIASLDEASQSREIHNQALVLLTYAHCARDLALAQQQIKILDAYFEQQKTPLAPSLKVDKATAYHTFADLHYQLGNKDQAASLNKIALALVKGVIPQKNYKSRDIYELQQRLNEPVF